MIKNLAFATYAVSVKGRELLSRDEKEAILLPGTSNYIRK